MCVVSMIGDHFGDKWQNPNGTGISYPQIISDPNSASKQDLEALRKEVLEMKELLKKAIEYDKKNNEPNCQIEDKIAILKKVAEIVGVDLKDIL